MRSSRSGGDISSSTPQGRHVVAFVIDPVDEIYGNHIHLHEELLSGRGRSRVDIRRLEADYRLHPVPKAVE